MLSYWQTGIYAMFAVEEGICDEKELYVEIISFRGISSKMGERGFGFGFCVFSC